MKSSSKSELITKLKLIFHNWEKLLAEKSEHEITVPDRQGAWAISDVIAHLAAWQQVSIARVEAALDNTHPRLPSWLGGADPFYAEDHVNDFNARIYEIHHGRTWSQLYNEWREGFLRFLELSEAVPDASMFNSEQYSWLRGYALSSVLEGSCDHHEKHLSHFLRRRE